MSPDKENLKTAMHMANNDTFSIYIHHGGAFVVVESNEEYFGGLISSKDGFDIDRFGYLDLKDEVENLGYISWDSSYFRDINTQSYKVIKNDQEVLEMISDVIKGQKYVSVYVDNGKKKTEVIEADHDKNSNDDCLSDQVMKEKMAFSEYNDTTYEVNIDELVYDDEYILARENKSKARMVQTDFKGNGADMSDLEENTYKEMDIQTTEQEFISEYENSDGDMYSMSSGSELSIVEFKKFLESVEDWEQV